MDSNFNITQEASVQIVRARPKDIVPEELISELIVSSQGLVEKGIDNVESEKS